MSVCQSPVIISSSLCVIPYFYPSICLFDILFIKGLLFFCLSIFLYEYLTICPVSIFPSVYVCLSAYLSVYMFIYLFTCLSILLHVYLSFYMFIYLFTCLSIFLHVYLSFNMIIYLLKCLIVYLCIFCLPNNLLSAYQSRFNLGSLPLGDVDQFSTSSGSDHTRSQKAPLFGIS